MAETAAIRHPTPWGRLRRREAPRRSPETRAKGPGGRACWPVITPRLRKDPGRDTETGSLGPLASPWLRFWEAGATLLRKENQKGLHGPARSKTGLESEKGEHQGPLRADRKARAKAPEVLRANASARENLQK